MTTSRRPDNEDSADTRAATGVGSRELTILLSSIMALMAVGLDLVLPAFDDIRDDYGLGEGSSDAGQIITVYFLGMAVAQLIWGPLADRFGRKPVLMATVAVYVIGASASALAPSFATLLAARAFWGVGAAGARVVATSIVRDRYVGDEMARVMSQIMTIFVLVPIIAPSIGAVILLGFDWPATFWFCALCAVGVLLWSTRLNETLDPANVRPVAPRQVWASYREVAAIPVTMGYTIATVFLQVGFTVYLASSELVIGEIYGRDAEFPIIFGAVAVLFGISAFVNSRLVERLGMETMIDRALVFALCGSIALVALAVTGDGRPNFWVFMPLIGVTLATFMMLMPNMNTTAMVPVGHLAGSASAFISAIRLGVGAAIGGVLNQLVTDSVTPLALSILGAIIAMIAVVAWTRRRVDGTRRAGV